MNKTRKTSDAELSKALRLHQRFGPALSQDSFLQGLFGDYLECIRETEFTMSDSGVVAACSRCAATKGSCCFDGMDEGYGAVSLLVNLSLGSNLMEGPYYPGSCRFVGKEGCLLRARHSFCLNYFCPDLYATMGGQRIEKLRRNIGKQLHCGWELESALIRWIANAQRGY